MKIKAKLWRYLTLLVVMLIALNPEMIELAIVINAIGLDVFLVLVQIQILFLLKSLISQQCVKDAYAQLRGLKTSLIYRFPQAVLMNILVFSAVSGVIVRSI